MRQRFSRYLATTTLATLALGSTMCGAPGSGEEDEDDSGKTASGSTGSVDSGSSGGKKSIDTIVDVDPDPMGNPCDAEDAPEGCELKADPACGDGKYNLEPREDCDDGNSVPGDGCSGACTVEPYFECPEAGQPCVSTIVCGDGVVGPGEACDDTNTAGGDGCTEDCGQIEKGFSCRVPGAACVRVYTCGDGVVNPNEGCDDMNEADGDGCDVRCREENGFKCEGDPSVCTPTTCGDNIQEGAESCDDGNLVPFDGCSPTCRAEPVCAPGEACASICGDGITLNNEQCDDGNSRDGDGCSSTCQIEDGFACTQPEGCEGEDCLLELPIIYRDFTGGHSDFDVECGTIERGIPKNMLTAQGKPELSTASNEDACINTAASYADWYTDVTSNAEVVSSIVLYPNGMGGYVNRFGENGEPYITTIDPGNEQGGYGTNAATCAATCTTRTRDGLQCENVCRPQNDAVDQAERELLQLENTMIPDDVDLADEREAAIAALEAEIVTLTTVAVACNDDCLDTFATREADCQSKCGPCSFNEAQWCIGGEIVELDGNPMFFPIEEQLGSTADLEVASVPQEVYGGGWREDTSGTLRNFFFTSEIAYWFEYTEGMTAELSFIGDDDMWVFVNGKLAVDLGGLHVPVEGRFTLNANGTINQVHGTAGTGDENEPGMSTVAEFGLEPGNVYEVKVFQAERKMTGSSYKLTLSGFNAGASDCVTDCGDGELGPGEECDDGEASNQGGYNGCSADCTLGPRCGDGIQQDEEACDYGEGKNTGEYGGCAANCQPGPYCGDGITSDGEECDDFDLVTGTGNDGGYGECDIGCVLGPVCGDGTHEVEFEGCDDGNNADGDGCSGACKLEMVFVP